MASRVPNHVVPPAFMEGERAINNSIVIMAWPGISHRVRGKKGRKEMGRRNPISESEEKESQEEEVLRLGRPAVCVEWFWDFFLRV